MSDSEDQVDFIDEEGGDDLFGDGGDEDDIDVQSDKGRPASDRDLASDNEGEERHGHREDDDEEMGDAVETQEIAVAEVTAHRHKIPKSKDGNVQSMRVPKFLKIHAEEYKKDTFAPTDWDMRNAQSENPKNVIRYQRDPATGQLQSNALVYRWSDGSVTLAVGNEHYDISKKDMIPPKNRPYEERMDAHYYAASASLRSNTLMTVGHISEQYTVKANKGIQDEALVSFASAMAAAAKGKRGDGDMIINTTKDPELGKKEAELAEKERMKAQRKRENAVARNDSRAGGMRNGGGLSAGMLEGRSGGGGARKRGPAGAKPKKRRNPEYDTDDEQPAGNWRGNEYDREDDFIASSDEEGSAPVEDDEEEEELLDDSEDDAPRKKRKKAVEVDEDEDAEGDDDYDVAPSRESKGRRRHVIDDDDDDEE